MTRSAEFATTVSLGVRTVQPHLVVHAHRDPAQSHGPRIGFVVSKSVGNAVQRHRAARRLRHAARGVLSELQSTDRIVIRALPGCADTAFAGLEDEMAAAVRSARRRREKR